MTQTSSASTVTAVGLGRWARCGLAVAGGLATALAFQPFNLWPLVAPGVAALTVAVHGVSLRRAAGLGYLYGLALLTLAVGWASVIAVPVAVALVTFEALWFLLLAVLVRLALHLPWWPLVAAGGWLLVEALFSRVPFGGFGWVRLAFAGADAPVNGLYPILGVPGVSYVVALTCQLVAWVLLTWLTEPGRLRWRGAVAAAGIVAVAAAGLGGRLYRPAPDAAAPVAVGMVQGNVDGVGLEFLGRERSVTNNHLSETVTLMAKARAGEVPVPDFVLWPENSTDIDPLLDPETRAVIQTASRTAGVPVLVGAVTEGPGVDQRQTTALWWDPAAGVTARYHKRDLVPFGEWIPFREQLLPLIGMLRLVGAQSVPGTAPGVLTVDVPRHGRTRVGVLICFELAYDDTVREMVLGDAATGGGAQVVTVQSNNATYAGTGQIHQQLAITRVRAMETRREILVATTNALSGYVHADGTVAYLTQERTADSTSVAMPVRSTVTPAIAYGPWVEGGLLAGTLAGLALAVAAAWRARRETADPDPAEGAAGVRPSHG